jgi:hypothetical protein
MARHSCPKEGVASLAHSCPKDGVASLAYGPAIHALFYFVAKTWMLGASLGMTWRG